MNRMELTERYRRADLACAKVHYRLNGSHMYENETILPDAATRRDVQAQLDAARRGVAALDAPEPVFRLLKRHLTDFLDGEALRLNNAFSRPASGVNQLSRRVEQCFENDSRPDDEKVAVLLDQLKAAPDVLAAAQAVAGPETAARLSGACAAAQGDIRHYAENIPQYLPKLSPAGAVALSEALLSVCARLDELISDGNAPAAKADDEQKCVPFTEEYYRSVLHDTLGVELDELLHWHAEEIEHTRAEVFEIASRLPVPERAHTMRDVNAILNRYAGPCDTPEQMFARMQGYLNRTQAAAREFVWFPEEVCRLERVPYPLRESFPWGGYSDGDGRLRPITGKVFLNNYNFRAVTDGWMKMQAVHESYPGHHIQYVRNITNTLPETLKLGAKCIPLIEGTAHRSERLFEFVFPEDPFYPLFVAYRRHHTAVRIRSDLMLRYYGRPIGDCVRLYMDELDFDHATARGQVLAQEQMEGYFTCYYYGMKKIADFEQTSGMDAKTFTELLFSCGNMSMENLHAYLRMDDAQRASWQNDFCSLLMDPQDVIRYRRG